MAIAMMVLFMTRLGGGGHWAVSRAQQDLEELEELAGRQLPLVHAADKALQATTRQPAFEEVDALLNDALAPQASRLKGQAVALHGESEHLTAGLLEASRGAADRAAVDQTIVALIRSDSDLTDRAGELMAEVSAELRGQALELESLIRALRWRG